MVPTPIEGDADKFEEVMESEEDHNGTFYVMLYFQ